MARTAAGPPKPAMSAALAAKGGRVHWIDAARGFGILLVVYGHIIEGYPGPAVSPYIYAFHIPLFFFLAGFVERPNQSRGDVLRRCLQRLVVPYLFFGLSAIAIATAYERPVDARRLLGRLGELAIGISRDWADLSFNAPLWFFTCLVSLRLLASWLALDPARPARALAASLLVFTLAWTASASGLPRLPWNIDIAAMSLPFFIAGQVLAGTAGPCASTRAHRIPLALAGIALVAACATLNGKISMALRDVGNPLLFLLGAGGGILAAAMLSQAVGQSWVLRRLGDASLVVFSTHLLWPSILPGRPLAVLSWYMIRTTGSAALAAAAVSAALVTLSVLLFLCLRRVAPALIGLPSSSRPGFA